MKKLPVRVGVPSRIYVGNDILRAALDDLFKNSPWNHAFIITNTTLRRIYGEMLESCISDIQGLSSELIALPDTERIKSFKQVVRLTDRISQIGYQKKTVIICFGGGVVSDLGGFTASIMKRGMPFVNIATTFLSQIDAAIGGKTAIDLPAGKNLVGTIWQPRMIICDTIFHRTLPPARIREGLAEAIKYGLIADASLFSLMRENIAKILDADPVIMEKIVYTCARIKRDVVEADEREEKGIRTILNFGHTLGHALETVSGYRLSHGNAVSIGMVAALYLSKSMNLLKESSLIEETLSFLKAAGMPSTLSGIDENDVLAAMRCDKKFISGKTRFVLLERKGTPLVVENVPISRIRSALRKILH